MIHYQLRCEGGHEFDGWFQDSAGFAANLAKDVESKRKLLGALGMIK